MSVQRDEKKMWAALDQFFLRVLGEKTGRAVMQESREQAAAFLAAAQEPSPSRLAVMQSTILPRTAVYTVLKRRGLDAEKLMEKYIREVQGPVMHDRYARVGMDPALFLPFSAGLSARKPLPATHGTACSQRRLTALTSPSANACGTIPARACGCPEACRFFCECDNYSFGDLKKVGLPPHADAGYRRRLLRFSFLQKIKAAQCAAFFIQYHNTSRNAVSACRQIQKQADMGRSERPPHEQKRQSPQPTAAPPPAATAPRAGLRRRRQLSSRNVSAAAR